MKDQLLPFPQDTASTREVATLAAEEVQMRIAVLLAPKLLERPSVSVPTLSNFVVPVGGASNLSSLEANRQGRCYLELGGVTSSPSRSSGSERVNPASDAADEVVVDMLLSALTLALSSKLCFGFRRFTTLCFLLRPAFPCLPAPKVAPVNDDP